MGQMPKKFWREGKYNSWDVVHPEDSIYVRRTRRLHQLYPNLSLNELRYARVRDWDWSQKPEDELTDKQYGQKHDALRGLKMMIRDGLSQTQAAKEVGLRPERMRRFLGDALVKKHGRWIPQSYDSIHRTIMINDKDEGRIYITVTNKQDASNIGKYHNAVRVALISGDFSEVESFRGIAIVDADGQLHFLETSPERLYDIHEATKDPEMTTFYAFGR